MSGRSLTDAGFSRTLLRSGVDAWPWRHEGDDAAAMVGAPLCGERARRAAERRAVLELQAYSDGELAELDLARADIENSVRETRVEHDGGTSDKRGGSEERWAA